jgi:hypothetical protein
VKTGIPAGNESLPANNESIPTGNESIPGSNESPVLAMNYQATQRKPNSSCRLAPNDVLLPEGGSPTQNLALALFRDLA